MKAIPLDGFRFGRGITTCVVVHNPERWRSSIVALGYLCQREKTPKRVSFLFGRGIRIRTLNDGVRVRSVTVTLYLYVFLQEILYHIFLKLSSIFCFVFDFAQNWRKKFGLQKLFGFSAL